MALKVLMICPEFFPKLGGTEIQALNLSKELQKRGVEVSALTRMSVKGWPAEELIQGIPLRRIDYPRIRLLGGVLLNIGLALEIIRRRRDVDVLHFHIGGSHMILPLVAAKLLGKPAILKISGWWELEKGFLRKQGIIPKLMRRLFFTVDGMVALSDEIKTRLAEFGFPANKVLALPNGVDTNRFYPVTGKKTGSKIIFVGRLVAEKGVSVLLQAVARLKETYPDISVELVGEGYARNELEQLASDLSIKESVTFMGRMDDVADTLRGADIYVQPSISEGLPNSLLEAMACGLPVVVTSVGGMPDVVKGVADGIVVKPNCVDELSSAIRTLLDNNSYCSQLGIAAANKIIKWYSLAAVAEQYFIKYVKMTNH